MSRLILQTATRFMFPLLLLFSLFLLLRGHNNPGGGFSGGLVGAAAFALYALAYDEKRARAALAVDPRSLIAVGLLAALTAGCVPMFRGRPFLSHQYTWSKWHLPGLEKFDFGTTLLFDVGVYLVVIGVTLTVIWTLAEE